MVVLSTTEAEYVALMHAAKQIIWIWRLLNEISLDQTKVMLIHCDNLSTITITHDMTHHARTKHINISYHFICKWLHMKHYLNMLHQRTTLQTLWLRLFCQKVEGTTRAHRTPNSLRKSVETHNNVMSWSHMTNGHQNMGISSRGYMLPSTATILDKGCRGS